MFRVLILILMLSAPFLLSGQYYSATSNALSGLSILSESVADYSLSPVLGESGISSFYHRPFNTPGIDIFGLHSAIAKNDLILAVGTSYLGHKDYCRQNPYLNLNWTYQGLIVGATGHLLYDAVGQEDGQYLWSWDLGLKYTYQGYSAQLLLLHKDLYDEAYQISVKASPSRDVDLGIGYQRNPNMEDLLSLGIVVRLNDYLGVLSSWQNQQSRFGGGLMLHLGQWSIGYSVRSHPDLDLSHAISLDYSW